MLMFCLQRGDGAAKSIYIHAHQHLWTAFHRPKQRQQTHPYSSTRTEVNWVAMADESYKKVFLETHNQYRRKHQAPDLKMSEALCKSAQQWADHMLSMNSLGHSDTDNGENLFYAFSSSPKPQTGKEAVDSWYSEIKDYNFEKSGYQPETGHFTQVVWKSTTEVGVGMATDGNTIFVVGKYSPAGNMTNAGYYEKNVLPACE